MRLRRVGAMVAMVLTVGVACKSTPSGNGNGCKSTGAAVTVAMAGNSFSPASVVVAPGQAVCWESNGQGRHNVTADPVTVGQDSTWKLNEDLDDNLVILYTFNKIGTDYPYHCFFHNETGVVKVR